MKSVIAVQFARKRDGRTNYRRRLALLKSGLPRLVVRKTLTRLILQLADFNSGGDKVRVTVTSDMLRKLGWRHSCKNIPAAYLSGMLMGKKALAADINKAVPDVGVQTTTLGCKIFAAIKGAKDAGLDVHIAEDVAPKQFSKAGEAAQKIKEDFEELSSLIATGKALSLLGVAKEREKHGKA